VPAQDIGGYQFGVNMAAVISFLILMPISESNDFPRTNGRLCIVSGGVWVANLFISFVIVFGLGPNPYCVLYLCGKAVFFLFHFMATFPILWRFFIAGMRKVFETVYGAVRSAGSRV